VPAARLPRDAAASSASFGAEAAGLEDFHFHDLPHHFVSSYIMRGGSLPSLKQILGHADRKMTLRYAHLALNTSAPGSPRLAAWADAGGSACRRIQRKDQRKSRV
jgi:integrase